MPIGILNLLSFIFYSCFTNHTVDLPDITKILDHLRAKKYKGKAIDFYVSMQQGLLDFVINDSIKITIFI